VIRRLLRMSCAAAIATAAIAMPSDVSTVRARGGDEPIVRLSAESGDPATTSYIDQQGLETWSVHGGHDLDQYLFRSGSPINFSIDLDRDFGPVDEDGRPIPTNDLFGSTAKLTLRVFDIDEDYPGTDFQPERDTVWVNGTELNGYLSGANDQWSIVSFDVPAFLLRLPTAAAMGASTNCESAAPSGLTARPHTQSTPVC